MFRRYLLASCLTPLITLGVIGAAWAQSPTDIALTEAKKFSGTTLNYTSEAGLQALDPIDFSGPLFEKLTGIKINVIELPHTEMFTKVMAEHQAGTGAYDLINLVPAWLTDMASAGALEPLDAFIDKFGYRQEIQDIAPAFRDSWMTYQGKIYGLPDDGDVHLLYYRTDLFGDAANKEAYKAKYNADLAPPKTWEEFNNICEFFTEKLGPKVYGAGMILSRGQVEYGFMSRFRVEGGKFFDPNTMKATINSEQGIKALTDLVKETKCQPPGVQDWGYTEVLSAWLAGDLAMTMSWPPYGRWSAGYGLDRKELNWVPKTQIAGKVGYALPPGDAPELAAGMILAVPSTSKNKEAAYLFAQWMNSMQTSLERVQLPYAQRDPFRTSHYASAEYRSRWPQAGQYLDMLKEGGTKGLLDLSIKGTFQYQDALARAIQSGLSGTDPKEALDLAAKEWDEITESIGLEAQTAAYKDWSSKPNAYPK
ncbi:multiple sugar transport system substrate-binding protein [Rhodoligotrophos appendicifer]|uniref:ABC transporter substrate-binding protein n=1 Tax=Rhodoligotrophos appendicifer TaxID=987056 RepID=UPI001186E575|nr:sugar ABC transporter substrate-binding protein [Rhodoligotrophos appendicifer]